MLKALDAEMHISELEKLFPVKFELYVFDLEKDCHPRRTIATFLIISRP
jgi:hypothetical protein